MVSSFSCCGVVWMIVSPSSTYLWKNVQWASGFVWMDAELGCMICDVSSRLRQ